MIDAIQRPASYGVAAYGRVRNATMTGTELQRLVFTRAIAALNRIAANGPSDFRDFHLVLTDNRRLWVEVATQAARNSSVDAAKAAAITQIANTVIQYSGRAASGNVSLAPLIRFNEEMRTGQHGIIFTNSCAEPMAIADA